MANDRCWLVCKVCGNEIPVIDRSREISAGQRMEAFIEEHGQLLHGYAENRADRQPFSLEYEA